MGGRNMSTRPSINTAQWNAKAQEAAGPACVDAGYIGARDGATNSATTVASSQAEGFDEIAGGPAGVGRKWRKWQTRQYTATCYKTVYRRATDDD